MAATARILNHPGVNWTLRSTGFKAANFGLLSGSEALQKAASMRLFDEALAIGAKTVIMPECGHGYPALRWGGRLDNGDPLPFEVLAASEFVGREVQSGRLQLQPGDAGQTTGLRRFGTRPEESSANRSKPRAPTRWSCPVRVAASISWQQRKRTSGLRALPAWLSW